MKKLIFVGILNLLIISCDKKNNSKNEPIISDSITTESAQQPLDTLGTKSFCFMKVVGKDTVVASFDDNLGTISGKLAYKNYEKDSSKGDITGFKTGDTLKLSYEFTSEGTISKRDIYFVQKNNSLFEGIGDLKDDGGKMIYADEKKISFPENQKFSKVDCKTIDKILK